MTAAPGRVLVVEDSPVCAKMLRITLEHAGHDVSVVGSVPEALAILSVDIPDVVICDLLLGLVGNGYDVVSAIRAKGSRALCIAVTALINPEIEDHAKAAGFDIFLRKPLRTASLLKILSGVRL